LIIFRRFPNVFLKGDKMKNFVFACCFLVAIAGCDSTTVQLIPGPQGSPGVQGSAGPQGASGHSLVSETVSASWCECDEAGGNRLDIYLDLDDSHSVSEGDEFQSALVACHGMNGLNGAQGLEGAQGPQGVAGVMGPQGLPGDAGLTGPMGPSGDQGVAGPVGPAGPQGPQGTPGAMGPAGSGATVQVYTLGSSCQSVGNGYYAKKSSDSAAMYDDSDCSIHDFVATLNSEQSSNGQSSMWLSATRLAFADSDTSSGVVLRVLNFN
jgi:hypothetical protein